MTRSCRRRCPSANFGSQRHFRLLGLAKFVLSRPVVAVCLLDKDGLGCGLSLLSVRRGRLVQEGYLGGVAEFGLGAVRELQPHRFGECGFLRGRELAVRVHDRRDASGFTRRNRWVRVRHDGGQI